MPEIISYMTVVANNGKISHASFQKSERLCKKRDIELLFREGKIFRTDELKLFYRFFEPSNGNVPCKILISVPKKQQPLAVSRNKIKRLIREAWRKNNTTLYETLLKNELTLHVAFICFSHKIPAYNDIESKIILTLHHLNTLSKTQ